MISILVC